MIEVGLSIRTLQTLVPVTTADTLRSTGIYKTLTKLVSMKCQGDFESRLKHKVINLLDDYDELVIKHGVHGAKMADKAGLQGLLNLKPSTQSHEVEGVSRLQGAFPTEGRTDSVRKGKERLRQELGESSKKGGHFQGYEKVSPMVMEALTKKTTAKPVTVESVSEGEESEVQPRGRPAQPVEHVQCPHTRPETPHLWQPAQPAHCVQSSCGRQDRELEPKKEKVEEKVVEHEADQEQEQDETESDYEVVSFEKENVDEWILVEDDAF